MNLSFTSRINVAADILAVPRGAQTILLNPATELVLVVDQDGARMWKALATTRSIQDAYERLLLDYNLAPDRLRHELSDFVGQLWLQTMIQFEPETPAAEAEMEFAEAVLV